MKAPTIPDALRICRVCEDDLATLGGLCPECDRLKYLLQVADDELPPPLRFVGDGATKTFKPAYGMPREEEPSPLRITEVPPAKAALPASAERAKCARRQSVVRWLVMAGMAMFVLGFVFGRMCH